MSQDYRGDLHLDGHLHFLTLQTSIVSTQSLKVPVLPIGSPMSDMLLVSKSADMGDAVISENCISVSMKPQLRRLKSTADVNGVGKDVCISKLHVDIASTSLSIGGCVVQRLLNFFACSRWSHLPLPSNASLMPPPMDAVAVTLCQLEEFRVRHLQDALDTRSFAEMTVDWTDLRISLLPDYLNRQPAVDIYTGRIVLNRSMLPAPSFIDADAVLSELVSEEETVDVSAPAPRSKAKRFTDKGTVSRGAGKRILRQSGAKIAAAEEKTKFTEAASSASKSSSAASINNATDSFCTFKPIVCFVSVCAAIVVFSAFRCEGIFCDLCWIFVIFWVVCIDL
jgi:hypothetical protein